MNDECVKSMRIRVRTSRLEQEEKDLRSRTVRNERTKIFSYDTIP